MSDNYQNIVSNLYQNNMNSMVMVIRYYTVQIGFTTFRIDERYQNLTYQGDGSFGCVVSAYDTVANRPVAIKKIREPFLEKSTMKRLLREMKLLKHFNGHENVVALYDIMTDPPNVPEFHDIYLVTNLFETDMHGVIRSLNNITEQHFQFFIHQTLRALKYIHSANVIHRDLKPSNILVNSSCNIAVCDFGLGRNASYSLRDPLTDYVVTRYYRAPELLCECPSYGKPVDIWSVGCIFAELVLKRPFFRGETPLQQLEQILNKIGAPACKDKLSFITNKIALNTISSYQKESKNVPHFGLNFPEGTPYLLLDLLKRMLQFNPDDRITVDEALNHPYLKIFQQEIPIPLCPEFTYNFEKSYLNYDLIFSSLQGPNKSIIESSSVSSQTTLKKKSRLVSISIETAISSSSLSSSSETNTMITDTNLNHISSSCTNACPTQETSLFTTTSNAAMTTTTNNEEMIIQDDNVIAIVPTTLSTSSQSIPVPIQAVPVESEESLMRKAKIHDMVIKETRYHVLKELTNYRPLSNQMAAFLTYGNPELYI